MGRSFDETFASELEPLHAYLARRLGRSAADDLAAETFAVAYRRWDDVDPERPVRPWLYGIASNLVRHHWRKERRMLRAYARTGVDPVLTDDAVSPARLEARLERAALAEALAELRDEEREVLLLHAWAELSDAEIAESLSLPLGTVKSRLSRAREHMRNRLGFNGQVEVDSPKTVEEQP
ncbi:MAG TPA: RNA polymerase sigma factor [Gaiellaceae bacterium]|nr:RNA polymerase sigma factor [Gaiellaceae bacterium]